jgi:Pg-II fimbriae c
MKKQFFAAALILALGAGFTACSNDDLSKSEGKEVAQSGTAYMSVSFTIPAPATTRAEADPARYQYGNWNGQDKINSVKVYVFGDGDKLEKVVTLSNLSLDQRTTGTVKVSSNEAFKVKPGAKKVYVVVNPTDAVTLPETADTPLATFADAYDKVNAPAAVADGADDPYYPKAAVNETRADKFASVSGQDDVILMTGDKAEVKVDNGVTEQEAISGVANQVHLKVERAVARVVVTSKEGAAFEIKGDDPMTETKDETVLATLTDITYTVAQSERAFNFLKKENGTEGTTQDKEANKKYEKTPAFAQKTTANDNFWSATAISEYQALIEHYDYSGLWKAARSVKSRDAFIGGVDKDDKEVEKVTGHITAETGGDHGIFVLPTTHLYGATADASDYRKSNTAYILVRGVLTPKVYVNAQGKLTKDAFTKGSDFYVGANGLVYASKDCVQNPDKGGVKGQTARFYKGGKALYFVWIHPDKLDGTLNSPVDRNNIYHVQLKGVASWGANWNPLVPYPKTTPEVDPKTGKIKDGPDQGKFPKNPNNPDDRPNDNPFEPVNPPVNPNENITPKETWMAAEVTILPWAVHSYEHILK